jgi:hypothetical protein
MAFGGGWDRRFLCKSGKPMIERRPVVLCERCRKPLLPNLVDAGMRYCDECVDVARMEREILDAENRGVEGGL